MEIREKLNFKQVKPGFYFITSEVMINIKFVWEFQSEAFGSKVLSLFVFYGKTHHPENLKARKKKQKLQIFLRQSCW